MLHDSPILQALDRPGRDALVGRSVLRLVAPGEALFLAGDPIERVHILTSGTIKLTGRSGDGRETILALATPGEIVGDISAVDGAPQPLDAIAATPCKLRGIDAKLFVHVVSSQPAATQALLRSLASRHRWICSTALERSSNEVPARLAGRLLDLADLLGRCDGTTIDMVLPLAQEDLGRLAGMCRESTCKTLRHFRKAGLVDYRGKRLRILRPDALEHIRCGGKSFRHGGGR